MNDEEFRMYILKEKELAAQRGRDHREKYKEYYSKYQKEWHKCHRGRQAEYKKEWIKTEKGKACSQRGHFARYIREKEVSNTLTAEEWLDILEKYDYKCVYCGREFNSTSMPTRDHIIPLTRGGGNMKDNIKPACRGCNSRKHTKLIEEIINRKEVK